MTVKELRDQLAAFPEDWPIVVNYGEGGFTAHNVEALPLAVVENPRHDQYEGDLQHDPHLTHNAVLIA